MPNIHTSNIMQKKQVIFRNLYVYTYLHAIAIRKKKELTNRKESGEGYMRGQKGKGERLKFY